MTSKRKPAVKGQKLTIELSCTEDQYPVIGIRSRIKFKDWVMLYQFASADLAKDRRIGGAEFRVLHILFSMMGYEGSVQISQADIGKMIGMKQQSVSTAIKTLIEVDILRSEGKPGQTATYVINPYYGSRGKASNVVQMQRTWDADQ
jgi:predicted RNA-binding protein YlqC (UPF0109 family)